MKQILPAFIVLYIFSLLGELGSFWWFFDLFSHWRMVYLLAGLVLVIGSVVTRQLKWTFTASAVLAYHLVIVAAFNPVFPQTASVRAQAASEQSSQARQELTVAFANTYWKNEDMGTVVQAVKEMNTDVVFMEEIQPEQFEEVKAQLPDYTFALHAPVAFAFDMGVLSKVPVESHTIHFFLPRVPLIEVVVKVNGKDLHLMGVHPYSPVSAEFTENRNEYLEKLFEYADNSTDSIVMGGDYNITQFSPVYRDLMRDSRMIDTQNNFKLTSTWPTSAPKWAAIPIDQVFVTPDVKVSERYRGAFTGSDHWPIVVRVGL